MSRPGQKLHTHTTKIVKGKRRRRPTKKTDRLNRRIFVMYANKFQMDHLIDTSPLWRWRLRVPMLACSVANGEETYQM